MDNRLIFLYNLIFVRAKLDTDNVQLLKASAGERRALLVENGASSGVTRMDIQSVLMNSRVNC